MAYSAVTRTAFGAEALDYVLSEKGHNNAERRNEMVTPINMRSDISYKDQMKKYWFRARINHKTQIIRIIQSFSKKEFDPNNPADILKANELGQEFVDVYYPNRQALVCTQTDGMGGCVHNHILVNDVSVKDGKGCDKEQYYHPNIKMWTDKLTQKYTVIDYGNKCPDKLTQTERVKLQNNEYSYKIDLRKRILEAMKISTSEENFFKKLTANGVDAVKKSSKIFGDFYTYELVDFSGIPAGTKLPNHALKARSYKLGANYGPEALQKSIELNKRIGEGRFTADEYLEKLKKSVTAEPVSESYEEVRLMLKNIEKSEASDEVIPKMGVRISAHSAPEKSEIKEETTVIPVGTSVQNESVFIAPENIVRIRSDDSDEELKEKAPYRRRIDKPQINKLPVKSKPVSKTRNTSKLSRFDSVLSASFENTAVSDDNDFER